MPSLLILLLVAVFGCSSEVSTGHSPDAGADAGAALQPHTVAYAIELANKSSHWHTYQHWPTGYGDPYGPIATENSYCGGSEKPCITPKQRTWTIGVCLNQMGSHETQTRAKDAVKRVIKTAEYIHDFTLIPYYTCNPYYLGFRFDTMIYFLPDTDIPSNSNCQPGADPGANPGYSCVTYYQYPERAVKWNRADLFVFTGNVAAASNEPFPGQYWCWELTLFHEVFAHLLGMGHDSSDVILQNGMTAACEDWRPPFNASGLTSPYNGEDPNTDDLLPRDRYLLDVLF